MRRAVYRFLFIPFVFLFQLFALWILILFALYILLIPIAVGLALLSLESEYQKVEDAIFSFWPVTILGWGSILGLVLYDIKNYKKVFGEIKNWPVRPRRI